MTAPVFAANIIAPLVKGLDFSHVFLLGMDRLQPEKPRQRRLAYVGMTRAREHLTLAICGREGLVPVLTAAER